MRAELSAEFELTAFCLDVELFMNVRVRKRNEVMRSLAEVKAGSSRFAG